MMASTASANAVANAAAPPGTLGAQPVPGSAMDAGNSSSSNSNSSDPADRRAQQCTSSSYSSSPRQFPSDLPDAILEEGAESGSESPIEPVTPVSGRHSQDFTTLQHQDQDHDHANVHDSDPHHHNGQVVSPPPHAPTTPTKVPILTNQAPTPKSRPESTEGVSSEAISTSAPTPTTNTLNAIANGAALATVTTSTSVATAKPEQEPTTPTLSRRPTRGSTSSFKRTVSNLFRRNSSQLDKDGSAIVDTPSNATESQVTRTPTNGPPPSRSSRRFSINKTSTATTTRSNTPPSPESPTLEMASTNRTTTNGSAANGALPVPEDFKQKNRASTGLTLRGRAVNFVGRGGRPNKDRRRASSFDATKRSSPCPPDPNDCQNDDHTFPPERFPWPLPPDAGTGAKARRMSLSLPDDFTVDVADLQTEYEYTKILGRHGKHLGKGAASKVSLMSRKGYPAELFAVKEFRGKSKLETQDEYDKKIKSEFSIAKSLHHPNIVETTRLCRDQSRWNHVMEYCSEGDMYALVQKGHLKGDLRQKDRVCLFKQLVQGISYLHSHGIAHRDIKLENLLMTKDSKLKITDFGVSEVFSGTHPGLREAGGQCGQNMGEVRLCSPGICGSEPYIAPEVLAKKEGYDPRGLDVWGAAVVMIYLTFGGCIWSRAEAGYPHYDKLVRAWDRWHERHPDRDDIVLAEDDHPKHIALESGLNPPPLRRLVLQMLHPDPKKRITMGEVANTRWMKNAECCQVESYDDPKQVIDATKLDSTSGGFKKIFCHNHLPPKASGNHSVGIMPGQPGY